MNKLQMIGRTATEPEIRYTQNQDAVANFRVAVDRRYKREGQTEADFFQCTAFGKTAEFIEKYIRKGTKIGFSGRLQNDEYTNKDGVKITKAVIIVEEIEFCEKKQEVQQAPANADQNGFMQVPDNIDSDELPFNF